MSHRAKPQPHRAKPQKSSPRQSKPGPQRRAEILDAAQQLFTSKGVQATSIEDILNAVGIARGTLYYHFSSKEEILQALIARITGQMTERAKVIAEQERPAVEKFIAALAAARAGEMELELVEELHVGGNAEFHVLSIVETVRRFTPILVDIVEQGIAEGVFHTEHSQEVIEILLTSAGMLLDGGIFVGEEDQIPRRMLGIVRSAEVLLGCAPGALAAVVEKSEETPSN